MSKLEYLEVGRYTSVGGASYDSVSVTYQVFGRKLHSAPVVLVNHSLTGNSDVSDERTGWWKELVGQGKAINLEKYTVICFNIPGNGKDNFQLREFRDFCTKDVALIFARALNKLGVSKLFAAIGGSLGGGIVWEMTVLFPALIQFSIPIASHYRSSDWIIAFANTQESILTHSQTPIQDARKVSMMFFRTIESFSKKFDRQVSENTSAFKVESWLEYHGLALENRFSLSAYKAMNHLLKTVDISGGKGPVENVLRPVRSEIIQIGITSDLLFSIQELKEIKSRLDTTGIRNQLHTIDSIHGHDAFLIEYEQLSQILKPIFN